MPLHQIESKTTIDRLTFDWSWGYPRGLGRKPGLSLWAGTQRSGTLRRCYWGWRMRRSGGRVLQEIQPSAQIQPTVWSDAWHLPINMTWQCYQHSYHILFTFTYRQEMNIHSKKKNKFYFTNTCLISCLGMLETFFSKETNSFDNILPSRLKNTLKTSGSFCIRISAICMAPTTTFTSLDAIIAAMWL